ncbi:type IV toxin-antitoxin system YeeU family antitoxin, partial [Escherichia coli]
MRTLSCQTTLPGTTPPDDNHDRPWWGLPCTVTP